MGYVWLCHTGLFIMQLYVWLCITRGARAFYMMLYPTVLNNVLYVCPTIFVNKLGTILCVYQQRNYVGLMNGSF